jgi:hypothetical protein
LVFDDYAENIQKIQAEAQKILDFPPILRADPGFLPEFSGSSPSAGRFPQTAIRCQRGSKPIKYLPVAETIMTMQPAPA